jgi:hypothetical protein
MVYYYHYCVLLIFYDTLFSAYFPYTGEIKVGLSKHIAACVSVIPLSLPHNSSVNMFQQQEMNINNKIIFGRIIFYAGHILSKESW